MGQNPKKKVLNTSTNTASSSQFQNSALTNDSIATIDFYNKISHQRDTIQIDTSLTIHKEYLQNYQQKDLFGKVLFSNEGHFYNPLKVSNEDFSSIFPDIGFKVKQQNYLSESDIFYYSVATPFSEIQYRSVMEQGQILNSSISFNTSERLNFSFGYRGIRSLGKYVNQLSSNGNFWFSSHFISKNNRYKLRTHYAGQDLSNQENGGIVNTVAFESLDGAFDDRSRFDVYLNDATSFFKGHRLFFNHEYKINQLGKLSDFSVQHTFKHEYKFFEYSQRTLSTTIDGSNFYRFGDAYVTSNLNDQTRFNTFFNQFGVDWSHKVFGKFFVFTEIINYNYFYNKVLFLNSEVIPNGLNEQFNTLGAQYEFKLKNFQLDSKLIRSISVQNITDFEANLNYKIDSVQHIKASIQLKSKQVDFQKRLFQSDYISYNWRNSFNNEKINSISISTKNKWINGLIQVNNFNDYTYFSNDADLSENTQFQQIVATPKQYNKSINHVLIQANKEFYVGKLGFDNSIIYQEVGQDDLILNVPKFVFRQSTFYSNHFFKKALYLQTGFIVNYFSSYYANDYNPVIGDFMIQSNKEIGNYPVVDVFLNAKIQTFRVYLKYEHINALFSKNYYYAAPNQPFRDSIIRFGVTWDFFQ